MLENEGLAIQFKKQFPPGFYFIHIYLLYIYILCHWFFEEIDPDF